MIAPAVHVPGLMWGRFHQQNPLLKYRDASASLAMRILVVECMDQVQQMDWDFWLLPFAFVDAQSPNVLGLRGKCQQFTMELLVFTSNFQTN